MNFRIQVILLSIYCLLTSNSVSAQENNSDRVINLRQQIQELEKQSSEYKKTITQKQQEGKTLKRELSILENQIARLKINILSTNRKIDLTALEIDDLENEISTTKNRIDSNRKMISALLKQMNIIEKQDLAAVLLANPRISDFFSHVEHINNLQGQLAGNLKTFLELKNELEERKNAAENKKQEFQTLNRRQQSQKTASEENQVAKNEARNKNFRNFLTKRKEKKLNSIKALKNLNQRPKNRGYILSELRPPQFRQKEQSCLKCRWMII